PLPSEVIVAFGESGQRFRPTAEQMRELDPDKDLSTVYGIDREENSAGDKITKRPRSPEEKRLSTVLDSRQMERWRQLQNQMVLASGWIEVSLNHPDWPDYLSYSSEQLENHKEIFTKRIKQYQELTEELEKEKSNVLQDKYQSIDRLLTREQNEQLDKMFGVFRYLKVN
ncbi:MAG: hypothetical protein Q8M16_24785, partial [Pirellulaceae bacterium]|nr:hypothetical protein [Pirellulaceae bacterium]